MARIQNKIAVRANRLVAGNVYTTNLWSKASEHKQVELVGWFNEGAPFATPAVIKAAPSTVELHVRDLDNGETIVATKDPNGYGAMFVGKTRITFAEEPSQADAVKAAKAAAEASDKEAKKAAREKAKAEKAAAKAAKDAAEKAAKEESKAAEAPAEEVEEVTEEAPSEATATVE